MEKSVNSILELYKGSVVGEIPNNTLDNRSAREFFSDEIPGVLLDLLHAERNPAIGRIYVEDLNGNELAHLSCNPATVKYSF